MGVITFLREYDFSIVNITSVDFPLVFIEGNYRLVCLYPGGFRSLGVLGKRGLLALDRAGLSGEEVIARFG